MSEEKYLPTHVQQQKMYQQQSFDLRQNIDQSEHQSTLTEQYSRLLNTIHAQEIDSKFIKEILRLSNIHYDQSKFYSQIIIEIEEYSANFEAVKLNVEYGYFGLTINIINTDCINPFRNLQRVSAGSFGQICKYGDGQDSIAIKSIKIDEDKFDIIFRQVTKEYTLLKIASALKAAPMVNAIFGFDIIVSSDSFNFCMEYCDIGTLHGQEAVDLNKKLYTLHRLHIVHLDIKPANIGFSNKNEYVFVDYGLSKIIKEGIGSQTLSSFTGSINFCSNQMLQLFSKAYDDFIDLYYNDAYCLVQALKKLNQNEELSDEKKWSDQYFNGCQTNAQQLSAYKILLEIKFSFFELSAGSIQAYDIFSQHPNFLRKYKYQIISFISYLPQTLQLIKHIKNEITIHRQLQTNWTQIQKVNLRNYDTIQSELFKSRFQKIQTVNSLSIRSIIHLKRHIETNILFEIQNIKSYRQGMYKLALLQFIKINSTNKNYSDKLKACMNCFQIYFRNQQQTTDTKLYKMIMQFIFTSSVNTLQPENAQIIINSIETIFMLELFNQQQILDSFNQIMNIEFTFIQKIRISLQFLTSLQFIKYKIITYYQYQVMSQFFMSSLKKLLQRQQDNIINDKQFHKIIAKLLKLIQFKQSIKQSPHSPNSQIATEDICEYLSFQLHILNDKIQRYMLYEIIRSQLQIEYACSLIDLKKLLLLLNKQNHYCQIFTYIHFILFRAAEKTAHTYINDNVYHLFYQELKSFEKHKYYDIHLFSLLTSIKKTFPTKVMQQRQQLTIRAHLIKQSIDYGQIFDLLDIAVKNNNRFYIYVGYLMVGQPALYLDNQCVHHIGQLIRRNRQLITRLSNQFDQQGDLVHYKALKYEIVVASQIFQFISTNHLKCEQWDEQIADYLRQCEDSITKIACFQCKVLGLLEVRSLYRSYLSTQRRSQQSFLCTFDLMIFYMKNQQLLRSTYDIIIPLIRTWCNHVQLLKKYNLIKFIYEFSITYGFHHYTLVDIRQYNIFLHMYVYIAYQCTEEQLINFILKLTQALDACKSNYFFDNFYFSILHLVKMTRNSDGQSFKLYHASIISKLLQFPALNKYPFIALYFSALLQMRAMCSLLMKMLRQISKMISRMGKHTKNLITNQYYEHFADCCEASSRRRRYVFWLHIKKSFQKFKSTFILKAKLKAKMTVQNQKIIKYLKHYTLKFHRNIDNLKQ